MAEYEITCINKSDRMSPHERVQYVGNEDGKCNLTLQSAVARYSRGQRFFVIDLVSRKRVEVGVVPGHGGTPPFLRTYADVVWRDNLLALPECSPACRIID